MKFIIDTNSAPTSDHGVEVLKIKSKLLKSDILTVLGAEVFRSVDSSGWTIEISDVSILLVAYV